jgi:aldehyde dehydrogenase
MAKPIAEFPRSTAEDIDKALDAAHAAADAWGATSVQARSLTLLKIADRIEQNLELLAITETWDNGKAVRETLNADIPLAADHFRYFAGVLRAQEGSAAEIDGNTVAYHIHEPLGVVGQIIPWNFPILMAAWKLAPALAAGNCVVLKPAEQTPLGITVLMELIGDLLPKACSTWCKASAKRPAKPGHQQTHRQDRVHRLDPGRLAHHEMRRRKHHSVHRGAGWQVAEHLLRRHHAGRARPSSKKPPKVWCWRSSTRAKSAPALPVPGSRVDLRRVHGSGDEESPANQTRRPAGHRHHGRRPGVRAAIRQDPFVPGNRQGRRRRAADWRQGGKTRGLLATGYYIQPTLLKGTNKMRVFQEEIFGPVVSITTFKDEAEALAIANDTEFGLGAGLWTRDINRAYRMGRAIKAGRVWTNCYHLYPAHAAFGGYKKSGVGRETHKMMLDHYQQTKNLLVSYDINPLGFF